ncbi:MAG: DnaB-like helicase N-terminal domain-containing protein [Patescibacteria group bacterium]
MPRYKTPPHNDEVEMSVIGSVFIDNACLQYMDLSPADFYHSKNQVLWKAILDLHAAGTPLDLITITDHLKKYDLLDAAGGVVGIAETIDSVPTAANVSTYVKILKDKSARRKFIDQMRGLAVQAYDDEPMENIIDDAQVTFRYILEDLVGKKKTMAEEVREWVLSTQGHFVSTDVHKYLQVSTTLHKKNISEIFRRLIDEGVIERVGDKNGHFRRVEREIKHIKWWEANDDHADIILPLDIHSYVHLQPGNLAVVAGCKNAGKSAFCLNTAALNMYRGWKVKYLSSEMWEAETKSRLKKFESSLNIPIEDWKQVDFIRRGASFSDVIKGEAKTIYIIDFLKISTDFYLISQKMQEIYASLGESIGLVAIQKNRGASLGTGGDKSAEEARLYVTLEGGRAQIVYGKNWAIEGVNPDGLVCDYKLIQGCKFIKSTEWDDEKEQSAKKGGQKW